MAQTLNISDGVTFSRVVVVSSGKDGAQAALGGDAGLFPSGKGEAQITLGRDARLSIVLIILPGVEADLSLTIDLDGEGAEADISGLYLCPDAEKVKVNVNVRHKVPHCSSHQLFKGIVGGTAHTSFYGKIIVAPHAQKTEAYQENHNLLLSDTARADTRPQLEIYADDVKCSHGATIGRLDEDAQFYMRSRGIPQDEAKVLQMISFLAPVIDRIENLNRRSLASDLLNAALRSLTA